MPVGSSLKRIDNAACSNTGGVDRVTATTTIGGRSSRMGLGERLSPVVADFYDIPESWLFGPKKHGEITAARRCLTYVLMKDVGWSSLRVANFLHQKHPSILSGYQKSKQLIGEDLVFFTAVERLREEIFDGC